MFLKFMNLKEILNLENVDHFDGKSKGILDWGYSRFPLYIEWVNKDTLSIQLETADNSRWHDRQMTTSGLECKRKPVKWLTNEIMATWRWQWWISLMCNYVQSIHRNQWPSERERDSESEWMREQSTYFDSELFLNFILYGKSVGIPSKASLDVVARHRGIATDDILDGARKDMAVIWVGKGDNENDAEISWSTSNGKREKEFMDWTHWIMGLIGSDHRWTDEHTWFSRGEWRTAVSKWQIVFLMFLGNAISTETYS